MATEQCRFIICGPEPEFSVPKCSLAEYLIPKLKSHPKNNIIEVDSQSGDVRSSMELLTLSLKIGEGLRKLGLQQNDVVALVSKNRSQLFVAALAAIWQGGVAAPVDPTMKPVELKHMFGLIKPKFVFSEQEAIESVASGLLLSGSKAKIVVFNPSASNPYINFEDVLCDVDVDGYVPPLLESPENQLAVIMPSSGTTGLPKGVGLTHRNLIFQIVTWEASRRPYGAMIALQVSHFFWITGLLTLLLSVCTGMRRIFLKDINDVHTLEAIHKYKPNWAILAPSVLTSLMSQQNFRSYDVSSVKLIATGGSPLPKFVPKKLQEEWSPEVKCFQVYGMTEMAGVITNAEPGGDISTVGKLCPGITLKVVDPTTKQCLGPNKVGEFCVKSLGQMKCYVGNEDNTREVIDSEGWYHTGDLGYYDDDHNIYISDRLKEMIKVRNMQVAPVELEVLIESINGVLEAGVVGIPNEKDMYHLMALVVKRNGVNIKEEDIIRFVRDNLSEYKQLRGGVCFVHKIPRTPTGKIKRLQLKEFALSLYKSSYGDK